MRPMSAILSVLSLLIAAVTVVVGRGDREYAPPPGIQHQKSSDQSLSQLLNDANLSQLLDDPDLWLILKKRLGGNVDECPTADRRRNSTIIKTKDSLEAGAQFIAAPSVTNSKECEEACCKDKTCNTAVINLKDSKSERSDGIACYLFDCKSPSVCIFTSHPGFIILDFDFKRRTDQHADELDELAASSSTTSSVTTTTSTTTSSTTTSSAPAKTAPTQNSVKKHSAGLFSACHQSSDCQDQNSDCLSGYCICQQGYHVVEMQCRKDCDQELEFECANKKSPLFSECIAVYDYCDGTTQCTDGSDETSCLESSKHRGGGRGGHSESLPGDRGRLQSSGVNNSTVTALSTGSLAVSPKVEPTVPVTSVTTNMPPENTSVSDGTKTSTKVQFSPTYHDLRHQFSVQDANDEVKQEKGERYFWKMETNRGAIVALVLGIILTTALLIFAGCRLRHFRKRYRKGRHLNSNEADYLINGMYL